ncbi:hypothetical protein SAMN04488519_11251 [Algoriphagus ornithinivorans]|uniref:Uncharacterized protein n=1 Tax=Algoriphagus ornithinivorans TaxID=226506 RepID=A0A1I5JED5_9BACT|nr:hypothetical protein [Algoriphagus ornithinivorans]SFO71040.1 hypothetical protein SAMN04488519_11251 [Algoriphagus ornithinivorans]
MKNTLFIQADKWGQIDFLFVDSNRVLEKSEIIKIVSGRKLLRGKYDFTISKSKEIFSEVIKKIPKGVLIKGQLNERDSSGRIANFTCFYTGKPKYLESYLESCLSQIGKSYNQKSIVFIKNSLINYHYFQIFIYVFSAALLSFIILKNT